MLLLQPEQLSAVRTVANSSPELEITSEYVNSGDESQDALTTSLRDIAVQTDNTKSATALRILAKSKFVLLRIYVCLRRWLNWSWRVALFPLNLAFRSVTLSRDSPAPAAAVGQDSRLSKSLTANSASIVHKLATLRMQHVNTQRMYEACRRAAQAKSFEGPTASSPQPSPPPAHSVRRGPATDGFSSSQPLGQNSLQRGHDVGEQAPRQSTDSNLQPSENRAHQRPRPSPSFDHKQSFALKSSDTAGSVASLLSAFHRRYQWQDSRNKQDFNYSNAMGRMSATSSDIGRPTGEQSSGSLHDDRTPGEPMVIVSKSALSDLTAQVAQSMDRMRDLEEQVQVIPALQRRLDQVMGLGNQTACSSSSLASPMRSEPRFYHHNSVGKGFTSDPHYFDSFNDRRAHAGSLSGSSSTIDPNQVAHPELPPYPRYRETAPVKTSLDCGCMSIKEHIRYNTISREQRLNHAKSQTLASNPAANSAAPASLAGSSQVKSGKVDASINTDLRMSDVYSKLEFDSIINNWRNNPASRKRTSHPPHSGPNSSASSKSSSVDDPTSDDIAKNVESKSDCPSNSTYTLEVKKCVECNTQKGESGFENGYGNEEDKNGNSTAPISMNGDEPYSLGSSYQDPSDFEEYCAYGESLDRRTKDFMSNSPKIPNDLRLALITLNDFIRKERQIGPSNIFVDVIRREWFAVSATADAQSSRTKLYLDYFESFTKQLLNFVVNLTDGAGNTAMHYAASHYKLDIIKVLLDTKVCDVNCRNKAGYTAIMLLALANVEKPEEQAIARHLFSMGDVNVKSRTSGETALMLSASHGRAETCKLLLDCGADPSLQDFDGSTALMCGSEIGSANVVRSLLAHRLTDLHATDNDGLDALTIAMNNGHQNIASMLYTAKNVPKMIHSSLSSTRKGGRTPADRFVIELGASLRRNRANKPQTNYVRRADSLMNNRTGHSTEKNTLNSGCLS